MKAPGYSFRNTARFFRKEKNGGGAPPVDSILLPWRSAYNHFHPRHPWRETFLAMEANRIV